MSVMNCGLDRTVEWSELVSGLNRNVYPTELCSGLSCILASTETCLSGCLWSTQTVARIVMYDLDCIELCSGMDWVVLSTGLGLN